MSRRARIGLALLLVGATALGLGIAKREKLRDLFRLGATRAGSAWHPKKKPNVVIFSLCSVSGLTFHLVGGPKAPDPNQPRYKGRFANLMRGSYRFDNYISRHPWVNVTRYMVDRLNPATLRELGYDYYFSEGQSAIFRIPVRPFSAKSPWDYEGAAVLDYREDLPKLKEMVTSLREPFVLQVHMKYMHFPYYDEKNVNFMRLFKLKPELMKRFEELKARKTVAPEEEIPIAVLFDRLRRPEVGAVALLMDKENYRAWEKTPNFYLDRRLIQEVYKQKWDAFVWDMQDFMNLYGLGHLNDDTIFVFDGDHGEAMMQHGLLGHASHVYEEFITSPLWIRFPPTHAMGEPLIPLNYLVHKETVGDLLVEIIRGNVHEENLERWLKKRESDVVVSRNCSGTIYSARTKDRWKLIVNFETGERELYDLNRDPSERSNLLGEEPDRADDLYDELMLQKGEVDAYVERDNSGCNSFFNPLPSEEEGKKNNGGGGGHGKGNGQGKNGGHGNGSGQGRNGGGGGGGGQYQGDGAD